MSRKLHLAQIVFATSLLVACPYAWAQSAAPSLADLSLEELMNVTIDSASKFEQKLIDAPASVSIVTAEDIKKYGYRNLAEILRSVRGLFGNYDRNYSYLGMRGFSLPGDYNSRIVLLVDGHRMNDRVYDYAQIGNDFPVDVDLIDRVEVIRGSSSSLYGTNALLGVVNIRTKTADSMKGLELSGEGGRFSTYKGRLSYANRFENGLEVLGSVNRYGSQGDDRLFYKEFNDSSHNFGIAENLDGESYGSFFGKLSYRDFSLEGGFIERKKDIPTASWGTLFDRRSNTIDKRGFLDLKFQRDLPFEIGLMTRAYYDYYDYRGNYIYDYAAPGDPPFIVTNKDLGNAQWLGGELQLSKTFFGNHRFVFGGEYKYGLRENQKNYDIALYLDDRRQSYNWALYLQDEFTLFKGLRVNAGIRYDRYSALGGIWNPRVALIYQPLDKTTLKLLYGHAFRAPNAYELYWFSPATKANPGLEFEKFRGVEFVVQQYLGLNLWGTVDLYYQRVNGVITQQTDPADGLLVYENTDSVEGKGIEFELEAKWQNGIRARWSYALQRQYNLTAGTSLTNSPAHLVKFNGILPLFQDKLFLGVEEQYTADRKTLAGRRARDFFITNVTLFSEKIFHRLEMSATIYDLFNRKHDDVGAGEHVQDKIRQDGRGFRFKLTYRF